MPHTRLKFKLPGGSVGFSTDYPDEEFRILAAFPVDDELFVAFEASTEHQQAVLGYFDEAPLAYDVLHTDERSILIQYEMPLIPPPVRAVLASGNLVQFPVTLRDGWITFDLTTSHERLSRLKAEFEDAGLTYEVETSPLFSDRERAAPAYAEEVTRQRNVSDATFDALREHFVDREVVEITMLNAMLNFTNLVNTPLGIESDGLCAIATSETQMERDERTPTRTIQE